MQVSVSPEKNRELTPHLRHLLAIWLFLICADVSGAQDLRHWTTADGLPQNWINGILQTEDGSLWIGTGSGLVRFDGLTFSPIPEITSQLASIQIFNLHRDRQGIAWVVHAEGIDAFDGSRKLSLEGLERPLRRARDIYIYEDAHGWLWLISKTAGIVRHRQDQWQRIAEPPRAEIRGTLLSPSGNILIWEGNEPYRFGDGNITPLRLRDGTAVTVFQMAFLDRANVLWTQLDDRLARYQLDTEGGFLDPLDEVRSTELRAHQILDPTDGVWAGVASRVIRLQGRQAQALELGRRVDSILLDHEGSVWIGTAGEGLIQLAWPKSFRSLRLEDGLPHPSVWTTLPDADGGLWIGTSQGLAHLGSEGLQNLSPDEDPRRIFSLAFDPRGDLWAGGTRGLLHYRAGAESQWDEAEEVRSRMIFGGGGEPWYGGTRLIRRRQGTTEILTLESSSDAPSQIRGLHIGHDGRLWIATNGQGLFVREQGEIRRIEDPRIPLALGSFLEEDDGSLWITSREEGILRFLDGEVRRISVEQGLHDNTVHHMIEDGLGWVWMTSDRGIFRVLMKELREVANGEREELISIAYSEADGLPNIECNSGFPGPSRLADGRLAFPTQGGLALVDPARIFRNPVPPTVRITEVAVDYESTGWREGPLELGPEQRNLAISYTAFTYVDPQSTRFRYRLAPYDRDWIEAGSRRTATYAHLPPGTYDFQVQAVHADGLEGEATSLAFRIPPLWHERTWVRVLGVMAIVGFLWSLYRQHLRRLRGRELEALVKTRTASLRAEQQKSERQKEALAVQAKELEELDALKTRFFANVSHELRTPLTLILGPLEELAGKDSGQEGDSENFGSMYRNARKLEGRVDELLDLARLEAGRMPIHCREEDIVPFLRRRVDAFEDLAQRRGVLLALSTRVASLPLVFDAERLEKITDNLLANALKFTPRGGRVEVRLREEADTAVLEVEDSGVGIPSAELAHVFDRFRRVEGSDRPGGSGVGLALTRELVERHGGDIHVESTEGEGSCFTLTIPKGSEHLDPEDLVADDRQETQGEPQQKSKPPADPAEMEAGEVAPDGSATVLIAEDDDDLRAFIRSRLGRNYSVLEARDGEEALALAREMVPDVIVSDLMMPRMDGMALVGALRADSSTDHIPIVLLTARGSLESRVEGLERGADLYLTKPFSPRELQAALANLLSARERLRRRYAGNVRLEAKEVQVESASAAFLRRTLETVEENLSNPLFGVFELAEEVGLSRRQLLRKLDALTGEGPSDLIRRIRLERARSLLEQGAGNVSEIARSVGFQKPSHFAEVFRRTYGEPPSAFLEQN